MEHTEPHLYPAASLFSSVSVNDWKENPAFRFFGKRLFTDQSLPEFLNELLLILFSPKRLAQQPYSPIEGCFPSREVLNVSGGLRLEYAPSARLNLKLFAFLGASRLDTRHKTHREHFDELQKRLRERLRTDSDADKSAILRDLENLFLGLRSTGEGRTWCAQQFLPLCPHLLTAETIWNEKEAVRNPTVNWEDSFTTTSKYWSINRHRFMARGGEVLYYQLCLALSRKQGEIVRWNKDAALGLGPEELDPEGLRLALEQALAAMQPSYSGLDDLASLICELEEETALSTDADRDGEPRYQAMGWCAADSWKEGYLFAVELLHILRADVDIMERLALLETACGLQILRTLLARTAFLTRQPLPWPGYLIPVTALDETNFALRSVSQHACKYLRTMQERLILAQLPNCTYEPAGKNKGAHTDLEAAKKKFLGDVVSRKYAAGLFASLAKNYLGLMVPRTGSGERFVLSERILRLLVLTLVPAQKHLSLDTFKRRVRAWHGFVFDAEGFEEAQHWLSGQPALFPVRCDAWLHNMLEDGNFLIHLSDACSLVHNPIAESLEA